MDALLTDAILVDALPGDVRVAVISNAQVTDYLVDRTTQATVSGSVYLGRVSSIAPQIDAAFVDIGLARAGFLGAADAPGDAGKIATRLQEGQAVLVQATAEPLSDAGGDKGAKVTAKVTVPGRLLVLTPGDGKVRVSRKIKNKDRRTELDALLIPLRPDDNTGFVARTETEDADDQQIVLEAKALVARWQALGEAAQTAKAPACLYVDDALARARRLVPVGTPVLISAPDATDRVAALGAGASAWTATQGLFSAYGVDDALDTALAREVALPGGGSVVIERTAAVTAIDVNIGTATRGGREETALAVNLAAAAEIAAQVRLRNLGGLFVMDFARMQRKENRARVLAALRSAGVADPEGLNVAGETTFGLIEMTRARRRSALGDQLSGPCTTCGGVAPLSAETTAFDALRQLLIEQRAQPGVPLGLKVAVDVAAVLSGPAKGAYEAVTARLGRPLDIISDTAMLPGTYDVTETAR